MGELLREGHECALVSESAGSVWRCDCGRTWVSRGRAGWVREWPWARWWRELILSRSGSSG